MRSFNKIFVVALPRCATVSMSDALGMLEIPTAHLGKINGEQSAEHNNPDRLQRMHEQIAAGDYDLDILKLCRGLADYPVCCMEVVEQLDRQYPDSLFVNVHRDRQIDRWLQSVERQFIGLQLLKQGKTATDQERRFMSTMLSFREMTFGQSSFDAGVYRQAYLDYQIALNHYFSGRSDCFLSLDLAALADSGFARLAEFLQLSEMAQGMTFPACNEHSLRPYEAFMLALEQGKISSQTGIVPASC